MEIEKSRLETKELIQLEEKIKGANQKIEKTYGTLRDFKRLTPFLEELAGLIPSGVYLTNLSYQKDAVQIQLNGRADSRENFLLFQKTLKKNPLFTGINSPLSNLVKQKQIDFTLTFKTSDKILPPKLPEAP